MASSEQEPMPDVVATASHPRPAYVESVVDSLFGGEEPELDQTMDDPSITSSGNAETAEIGQELPYHRNADLYIQASEQEDHVVYKVSSALVAAVSPAWRKVVETSNSLGGDALHPVVLSDIAGHSFGLQIVLSIIHWRFHEVPSRLVVDELYSVAQVVEKYDCVYLLAPFMKEWVAGLKWHIDKDREDNDDDKTLCLTWALGLAEIFSDMVSKTSYKATLGDDGALLDARGQPWICHGIPPALLDLMTQARYNALRLIIKVFEVPLEELTTNMSERTIAYCRCKEISQVEACEYQQLGSLIISLKAAGLHPLPSADQYPGKVIDLARKAQAIKVSRWRIPGTPPHLDGHIRCGITHKEAIEEILRRGVRMSHEIVQQLEAKAKKSGAYTLNLDAFQKLKLEDCDKASEMEI